MLTSELHITAIASASRVQEGDFRNWAQIRSWAAYSRFGWAGLLVGGILVPARAGHPVRYRPPPWDERGRAGAIEVPAGGPLLIVESVGAARRECAHLIDVAIWV